MATKKYEQAQERYQSAVKNLFESLNTFDDQYEKFLGFAAKMYKMPFTDAIVIFSQNPEIKKAAELSTWNKLGRRVKRGEKAIVTPTEKGQVKYYYSDTQTVGRDLTELWTVNKETAEQLRDYYSEKHERNYENFNYVIDGLAAEYVRFYEDDINEMLDSHNVAEDDREDYISELITTIRYTIASRCELNNDGFLMSGTRPFTTPVTANDLVDSPELFADMLDVTQKYSQEALNEIYGNVKELSKHPRVIKKLEETVSAAVEGENIAPEKPLVTENNTVIVANGDVKLPAVESESGIHAIPEDVISVIVNDVYDDVFFYLSQTDNGKKVDDFLSEFAAKKGYEDRKSAVAHFILLSEKLTSKTKIDGVEYSYHIQPEGVKIAQNGSDQMVSHAICSWDTVTGLVTDKLKSLINERKSANKKQTEDVKKQTNRKKSAPMPDEQLSFFELSSPPEQTENQPVSVEAFTAPTFDESGRRWVPQEIVDHVLRDGSMERDNVRKIVFAFGVSDDISDKAEFLKRHILDRNKNGEGRGYVVPAPDLTGGIRQYASWYTDEGLIVAAGNNIRGTNAFVKLSWKEAAERISEMLDDGSYCSQEILDSAAEKRAKDVAEQLWNLHQSINTDVYSFFIGEEMFSGGFPESTERIKEVMQTPDGMRGYIDGMEKLIKDRENIPQLLRHQFVRPQDILQNLKMLTKRQKSFTAAEIPEAPKYFISETQKEYMLFNRSYYERGKFSIREYFAEHESKAERANFLKEFYGTGGGTVSGTSDEWHDSKGMTYAVGAIGNPIAKADMTWSEVAEIIDRLIREGRYISQEETDEAIRSARRSASNFDPEKADLYEISRYENELKFLEKYDIVLTESPFDKAIRLINEYCEKEFDTKANFSNMDHVDLAYTTDEETEIPIEVYADLETYRLVKEYGGKVVDEELFDSIDDMNTALEYLEFDDLVSLPEKAEAPGETFNDRDFEKKIPREMRWKEYSLVENNTALYWVTQDIFSEADLDKFQAALRDTDIEKAYVIPRDLSGYNFAEDVKNNAPFAVVTKESISCKDYVDKIRSVYHENVSKQTDESEKQLEKDKQETQQTEYVSVSEKTAPKDYVFNENDLAVGGAKTKYAANVRAIKTLKKVESENRSASPEEQAAMAAYSGWGGMPQAFDAGNILWKKEYGELKELISEGEYTAARASSTSSFYSPPEVIDGVYQALRQFGFAGGNVLEPSLGIGNFFAKFPSEWSEKSKLYGVEIDDISGRIAKKLYPSAKIQIKGFEETKYDDNSFDAVVGNVPFGNIRLHDKRYNRYNLPIHDYFAAKAIDQVRPGGIVAIVTSKFTMDKKNPTARKYLAERADLLGAVRLPAGAFKDTDNTTTDILFFKKKNKIDAVSVPDWVYVDEDRNGVAYNRYFHENPDMMLGTMVFDERMRGKYGEDANVTVCLPKESDGIPLPQKISEAIVNINGSVSAGEYGKETFEADAIAADPNVKNYTFTVIDDELYFRENEVMKKIELNAKAHERVVGMHNIRQAATLLINAEANGCSDNEMTNLQRELNDVYDDFVRQYGHLNDSVNQRLFRDDDDCNTLLALESKNENDEYIKAPIFFKRTINPAVVITSVDTPEEALQVSLDRLGKVDIRYMSQIAGVSPDEVITSLGDMIYRNPVKAAADDPYSGYEDASEYLSGNVVAKLDNAEAAAEIDSSYERNVEALKNVLPERVTAEDIAVRLGTAWITEEDYNKFYEEYTGLRTEYNFVTRTPIGEYKFTGSIKNVYGNVANEVYGTSRMNSYQIFENLLNQRQIVVRDSVTDSDGSVRYVVNDKATRFAREKARQMEQAFKDWIWNNVERRERYEDLYNRKFNCLVGRSYDGSKQHFDGMNPELSLYSHQKDAVMRAKLSGNTLLAHEVGAGKTFEMITIVEEKKRLGLIGKACVAVPKALTEQMGAEWKRLYPNANILVARSSDFSKDNRQRFFARCATGDYDAVIMSHEQFGKIGMSREYQVNFISEQVRSLERTMKDIGSYGLTSEKRISVKALERQKKSMEEKLKKLLDTPRDTSLSFEQLGFDYLVVDEAHNFKNCFVFTKMGNIAGVQTTPSQKAEDMLMKCDYLNNKYDCHNILFATGTPLSNSMTELYIMNRYLRPDLLRESGTINFDDWAAAFGETVTKLEPKPDGSGYRSKKRFSKFVNLPELVSFYKEFADIKTIEMIGLEVPKIIGGQAQVITIEPDEYQKMGVAELAERSELIHSGSVEPYEDNMLKITGEARLLGLDARTKYPDAPDSDSNKISAVVSNVMKHYEQTEKEKGVQAIFCDIAVNDNDGKFSAYIAIKEKLIEKGIPENEICFAGDAKNESQRAAQHEQLRRGEKRIVIGSTGKMGTGVNIQDRLCAMHHLDIAWKPSDFEQRNGRGIRQGNRFGEVGVYHYVTQDTFDLYMMETVVRKSKFIGQLKSGDCPSRTCEDIDDMTLTYSRIQAATTSNPLIVERFELEEELQELRLLRNHHQKNKFKLQKDIEKIIPEKIERYELLSSKAKNDVRTYEAQKADVLTLYVDGKPLTERELICGEIDKARKLCGVTLEDVRIGKCFGFDVYVTKRPVENFFGDANPYEIVVQGDLKYSAEIGIDNGLGNAARLANLFANTLTEKSDALSKILSDLHLDLEKTTAAYQKPFDREEEFQQKGSRLAELNELLADNEDANKFSNAGEEDDEQYENDEDCARTNISGNKTTVKATVTAAAVDYYDDDSVLDLTGNCCGRR